LPKVKIKKLFSTKMILLFYLVSYPALPWSLN
jgi:hypothetical protein